MRVVELLGPSTGGIRRAVVGLAADLRDRGIDVAIAGPVDVLGSLAVLDAVVPVPARPSPGGLWRAARALRASVSTADLIHAHGLKAGWVAMVCRRRPWVLTVHNVILETGGRWRVGVLGRLERFVIGRADHVIATSSDIERSFAAVARAITTIRPVHDLRRPTRPVTEVRAELAGAGVAVAVCVARLHPQKGLDRLIDAWAGVPDATLVVVGGGPLLDALTTRADRLGIGDRVRFLGARDDVADLLAAADLVVIPSRWESGPLVLLEAMALGKPVVTTRVGFAAEVAGEGSPGSPGARLLDVDVSSEELATALVELLDDEVQRTALGERARVTVAPFLDHDPAAVATIAVYRSVTA